MKKRQTQKVQMFPAKQTVPLTVEQQILKVQINK